MAFVVNWSAAKYVEDAADTARVFVHAIDATSGKSRWSSKIKSAWPSPPALTDRYVLFMTSPRDVTDTVKLHALDIGTGQEQWSYTAKGGDNYWKMEGVNRSPPLVVRDSIVLLATDTKVIGIDIDKGKERWRLVEPFQKHPINEVYLGPQLYILTGDRSKPTVGTLYGIDPENGDITWTMSMHNRNIIQNVIDGVIYIQTTFLRTGLFTVDGISGKELGTVWAKGFTNESSGICSGPVHYGDQLLVSTELQLFFGQSSLRGYLYSVAAPTRKSQ